MGRAGSTTGVSVGSSRRELELHHLFEKGGKRELGANWMVLRGGEMKAYKDGSLVSWVFGGVSVSGVEGTPLPVVGCLGDDTGTQDQTGR